MTPLEIGHNWSKYLTFWGSTVVALLARDAALSTAILLRRDDTSFLVALSSSRIVSTLPFTSSALTWNISHKVITSIGKFMWRNILPVTLPMLVTNMMSQIKWFLGKFVNMISIKRHADFNYKMGFKTLEMANPKSTWAGDKDHLMNKSIAVQPTNKSTTNKGNEQAFYNLWMPSYLKGWTQASHVVVPSTNIINKCITCNCLYPSDSRSYSLFWDYLEATNLSGITDMSTTTEFQWDPRDLYDSDLSEKNTKLL
jgi:hypothetical protein